MLLEGPHRRNGRPRSGDLRGNAIPFEYRPNQCSQSYARAARNHHRAAAATKGSCGKHDESARKHPRPTASLILIEGALACSRLNALAHQQTPIFVVVQSRLQAGAPSKWALLVLIRPVPGPYHACISHVLRMYHACTSHVRALRLACTWPVPPMYLACAHFWAALLRLSSFSLHPASFASLWPWGSLGAALADSGRATPHSALRTPSCFKGHLGDQVTHHASLPALGGFGDR